ncbi:MAG: UvrD-helicase domain-containing protein [Parachlamydiales bacterium]|jgi:exodeoxyribonuclease V beta subunit
MIGFPSFNVLSSSQSIEGHLLLEASAGTGKTFAIENIVVRSILEKGLALDRILVLTFTNAATNDLKARIRSCIFKTIEDLAHGNTGENYLHNVAEQGEHAIWQAKQKLRHNLFFFENSQIFTLHAFCSRTLTDLSLLDPQEWMLSYAEINECIVNYIRTSLTLPLIHPAELEILWSTTERVVSEIKSQLLRGASIAKLPHYAEGEQAFRVLLESARQKYAFQSDKVLEDFQKITKACGKRDIDKHVKRLRNFARLLQEGASVTSFQLLIEEGLIWLENIKPEKILTKNVNFANLNLHYPTLDAWIRNELEPLLRNHTDKDLLLLRLAHGAQKVFRAWMRSEYRSTNDDLLRLMVEKTHDPSIGDQIRSKYDLVIVDEFQDTDPSQWTILKNLFLDPQHHWNGQLILVGDPKQSIYAFRQADIYTYREAANTLGQAAMASLDTNFRSHPKLVEGLNRLFSAERVPRLIYLPSTDEAVYCNPVKAGLKEEVFSLLPVEEVGIEFVAAKATEDVNQYIAAEILRLKESYGFDPSRCAILVKDRYKGAELGKVLKQFGLPYRLNRDRSLIKSPAYSPLKQLVKAVLHCKDIGIVKVALGDKILNWNYKRLLQLNEPAVLAATLQMFAKWNAKLHSQGIAHCLQAILDEPCAEDSITYGEAILKSEEGTEFFLELFQIVELLLEHQPLGSKNQGGLIDLFDVLEELDLEESGDLAIQGDDAQGISIVTIHSSKGLEFDVVFTQGIIFDSPAPSSIIVKHEEEERVIQAVHPESEDYLKYCEEIDAEKMRQFYVTATRAKYKLYLFALEQEKTPKKGKAAIVDLYLSHLQGHGENYHCLYEGIGSLSLGKFPSLVKLLDPESHSIRHKVLDECSRSLHIDKTVIQPDEYVFIEPFQPNFDFSNSFISSYTGLAKHEVELLEHIPPSDWEGEVKSVHTLPAGAETGILFHTLLEKIDFTRPFDKQALLPFFQSKTAPWIDVVYEMLHQIVSIPLQSHSKPFALSEICSAKLYKETEFLFSSAQYGILKGVIDLCFEYDNKYYLLDWKTNWLGPQAEFYTPSHLQQAMQKNDYFLQAQIYMDALRKYFALVDKRPFEDCFGGYYYLFLRGIPSGNGIFSVLNPA